MPSKSKSQQRLFGLVHACQKGKGKKGVCNSPKIKKLTKSVKEKDAEDFASTRHEGLPEKVEESKKALSFTDWMKERNKRVDETYISSPKLNQFRDWLKQKHLQENQGETMDENQCQCNCEGCKDGDCSKCSCEDCKCENCDCQG